MSVPRILILLSAAAFAGFGVWFLAAPSALEDFASIGLSDPAARAEIRAMYGGLELGLAAFFRWCALSEQRYEAGLTASALAFLGLAIARLAGMALDSAFTAMHLSVFAVEVLASGLALWGLVKLSGEGREA